MSKILNLNQTKNIYIPKQAKFQRNTVQNKQKTNYTSQKQSMPDYKAIQALYFCGANKVKQQKQILPEETFFVRMYTYERKNQWAANQINEITYTVSDMISDGNSFEDIMGFIEKEVHEMSNIGDFCNNFGIKRKSEKRHFKMVPQRRGREYYQKYMNKLNEQVTSRLYSPKATEEFQNANVCTIKAEPDDMHIDIPVTIEFTPIFDDTKSNMELIKKAFYKLRNKENPTEDEINQTAATIQWLFAQETPYERGSDSIANIFTRALYHSYNMKVSPLKENTSCDFEAFYRDLDEYIQIYPTLFEERPAKL